MKFTRHLPTQPRRDAWLEINLGALEKNTRRLRQAIPPNKELMAIVKADAYGHGTVMVIPTLEASGVTMVGVAAMDEALQIRQAGLEVPVLVIGVIPDWAVQVAAEEDIQLTVFDTHHLHSLEKAYRLTHKSVKVHIKVDTGMHRIGIAWDKAVEFIQYCQKLPYIQLEGIFSHLASTGDPAMTRLQMERWQQVLDQVNPLPRYVHLVNSDGALLYEEPRCNLVRMGIAFFGYGNGGQGYPEKNLKLQPVMSVKARIIHVQEVPEGTGISYDHTFVTQRPSRIATLPLGYADGIQRRLSNQIVGILRGKPVPQVGNITMDQMMVDITDVPEAQVGEIVTLIGQDGEQAISMTDWARKAGTIEYELMCGLRVRLPKTYTR